MNEEICPKRVGTWGAYFEWPSASAVWGQRGGREQVSAPVFKVLLRVQM